MGRSRLLLLAGRRAGHWTRRITMLLVLVLMASVVAATPAVARSGAAAEGDPEPAAPPEGDIVPSAANVGRTEGEFSVSDDGAAQYNLALWTPDARGGGSYKPKLSLAYNSRGGNGVVGVGWSLSGLPSVTRCAKTIAQDGFTDGVHFTGSDAFCLGGNRLIQVSVSGSVREFRTEVESFARITSPDGDGNGVPDSFKVEGMDGTIQTYGGTANSRVEAFRLKPGPARNTLVRESTTRVVVAWGLSRSEDRNGNAATVEYEKFEGGEAQQWHVESRPLKITYEPNREVRFAYETRVMDPIESFAVGVHQREPFRLAAVQMFGGQVDSAAELLREYRLDYDTNSVTLRSLLHRVIECVSDPSPQPGEPPQLHCLRPLVFDWTDGDEGYRFVDPPIDTGVRDAGQQPGESRRDSRILPLDIDGDGRQDLLYVSTEQETQEGQRQQWYIRKATPTGFGGRVAAGFQTQMRQCPVPPGPPNSCTAADGQIRLVDHNLDGRMDVLVWVGTNNANPEAKQWQLFTSNGTSFVRDPSGLSTPLDTGKNPDPVHVGDLNGDGTPDIITAPYDVPPGDNRLFDIDGSWRFKLNNGSGGANAFGPWVDTGRQVPQSAVFTHNLMDVNADNRVDLFHGDDGWGLNFAGGVEERRFGGGSSGGPDDVNGDGLGDAIVAGSSNCDTPRPQPSQLRGSLNSGNGWGPFSESPVYWEPEISCIPVNIEPDPTPIFEPDPAFDRGIRMVDFNNDGNTDVLLFRRGVPTSVFDDKQGAQLYIWRNGRFERAPLSRYTGNGTNTGFAASQVLDFNGDGLLDIIHVEGDQLRVLVRRDGQVDQLVGIGDINQGPRTEISYTTLADRSVHNPLDSGGGYPRVAVTSGGSIVKQHQTTTKISGTVSWDTYTHTYLGARADVQGRGWLGFAGHGVVRALTGATTITSFDNATRDAGAPNQGEPSVYPFALVPHTVTSAVLSNPIVPGGPVSREYRTVSSSPTADRVLVRRGRGYLVEQRVVRNTELERLAGAPSFDVLRETETRTVFDAFGNADLVKTTTTGGRTLIEDLTFRNDTTNWLIGLAERSVTTSCVFGNTVCETTPTQCAPTDTGCTTRVSRAIYDTRGRPDVVVVEPDQVGPDRAALTLITDTDYDGFGNVTSVTIKDSAGVSRTKRLEYNKPDKLYVTDTIEVLDDPAVPELRSKVTTDAGLGVVLDATDANGQLTTMKHDRFGRLRESHRSDGSFEKITPTFRANGGFEQTDTEVSGGGFTRAVTDRFGRTLEAWVKTFNGGFAITHTQYDDRGRVSRVSRPAVEGQPLQWTTTTYDDRDRVTSVTAPDTTVVRHSYVNRETRTVDAKGVESRTVASVDGEVESSLEKDNPNATTWLQTRFEYGPFGTPTKVVAPDNTARVKTYDTLGRRLTLSDPSSGVTTTTYIAFGQVHTETNGAGERVEFKYDALGRMEKKIAPEGESTWKFDTAPNGKGKPASARSADGVGIDYRYNPRSKPSTTTWNVGGTLFEVAYGYDAIGRQNTLTYPAVTGTTDRLKIANVYNQHGYLTQVKDAATGLGACTDSDRAAGLCYWTAEFRNSEGKVTKERLGNGVVTDTSYVPTNGLVGTITSTGPGTIGKLGELSYVYDNNHNVMERHDRVDNRHDIYVHDTLNRLTNWAGTTLNGSTVVAAARATYTYNPIGNLTSETITRSGRPNETNTYGYGGPAAPPHALTARNGTSYTYDRAGRQKTGDGRTIEAYNSHNLPRTMTWGSNQRTTFTYDPDGARVRTVDNEQTLTSIAGKVEVQDPAGTGSTQVHTKHNIIAEGRVIAQLTRIQDRRGGPVTASKTWYLHQDALGSTSLITNQGAREPDEQDNSWLRNLYYSPWGERLDPTYQPLERIRRGPARIGFTGHDHDDQYGLIHMKGREYDPTTHRFTTPDPLIQNPLSSQNHNRYTYVQNNPTTYTDPTGFAREDSIWDCTGGAGTFCDDRTAPEDLFRPREGGDWTQINGVWTPGIWHQAGGGAAGQALRLSAGATDAGAASDPSGYSIPNNDVHAAELERLANDPRTSQEDQELLLLAAATLRAEGDASSVGNELIVVRGRKQLQIPTVGDIFAMFALKWVEQAAYQVVGGAIGKLIVRPAFRLGGTAIGWAAGKLSGRGSSETAGAITSLGTGDIIAMNKAILEAAKVNQGFSGVWDEATGEFLAAPSAWGLKAIPKGWVPGNSGHAVANLRLTEVIGEALGSRFAFTAILQADGSLAVRWFSRSVNRRWGNFVPDAVRPFIVEDIARATGRVVR